MKKTMKDFTPEIQAKIPEYIARYTKGIEDGERYNSFNIKDAEELIFWNYEKCGHKKPVVIAAENPYEAQLWFNFIVANKEKYLPILYLIYCLKNNIKLPEISSATEKNNPSLDSTLKKYNDSYLFTSNIYSNVLLAWWKFIKDEFNIETQVGVDLDSWNDLYIKSGVYNAIFSETLCIVSKYPKEVKRNENGLLHNPKGGAVIWGYSNEETRFNCYFINGRQMPKELFDSRPTRERFLSEENEDVRGGIYEIIENEGEGTMLEFLGAKEVDRRTFIHAGGDMEEMVLYRTDEKFQEEVDLNGISPSPLAWVKMICPSTGQQYLIPSDGSFKDCLSAAKFHRPDEVPKDLDYIWASRS